MKQIHPWEAARPLADYIPQILWNQKVHDCVHEGPSLDPSLSQMNPVHILTLSFFL
jgi:hypothetical protein